MIRLAPGGAPSNSGAPPSLMNVHDALAFLEHEAGRCLEARRRGDLDAGEMLCLLVPALCKICHVPPMTPIEAGEFRQRLRETLQNDFRFDPEPSRVGCGGPS